MNPEDALWLTNKMSVDNTIYWCVFLNTKEDVSGMIRNSIYAAIENVIRGMGMEERWTSMKLGCMQMTGCALRFRKDEIPMFRMLERRLEKIITAYEGLQMRSGISSGPTLCFQNSK